ncbi:MAG: hypothetical protein K0R54_5091 [Clostridiaceae bacterium]|jgi:hypothetical protein|nr:hypothetical protein [Clostridiaceae bacterium]
METKETIKEIIEKYYEDLELVDMEFVVKKIRQRLIH